MGNVMFGSLFCCSKKKLVHEKKQFCMLISDCVQKIESLPRNEYNAETPIKQLPKEIQDTIKEIYKKTKMKIDLDATPIYFLLNDLLVSPLAGSLNDLEKLMDKTEFQEFANKVSFPFEKSDNVCSIL